MLSRFTSQLITETRGKLDCLSLIFLTPNHTSSHYSPKKKAGTVFANSFFNIVVIIFFLYEVDYYAILIITVGISSIHHNITGQETQHSQKGSISLWH